ncbi:TetR/AcrR family transcriptional regulator, partial [Litorivivens sp.]
MPNKIYRPHFSTTSDARVVRTREALRKAMLDLLSTKPFEQITIRELAADAGIGYTTFFRHHPTKESLLEEIATEEIRQLIDYTLVTFNASDTDTASLALCQYVDQHRTLWSTLLTGGAASALRDEFVRVAQEVAAHTPEQSDWLPAEFGVILVASSTIELLAWWLRQDDPMPLEKIAEIYRRAVLGPVFTL